MFSLNVLAKASCGSTLANTLSDAAEVQILFVAAVFQIFKVCSVDLRLRIDVI